MTVSELIAALKAYPSDSRMVVLGYESGYDDITLVKRIAILPEEAPAEKIGQAEHAVLLYGRNDDR